MASKCNIIYVNRKTKKVKLRIRKPRLKTELMPKRKTLTKSSTNCKKN